MRNLIIVGTGDLAVLTLHFLNKEGRYRVIGFAEERAFLAKRKVENLPNIAFEELEFKAPPEETTLFIAVGPNKSNTVRQRLYETAKAKGYSFATYISPEASVWDVNAVGENTIIFPRVVLEPFAKIGNNCIVWSGALIAHHSEIGDHSFLAPGACISGRTKIGENCFIGLNATVRDYVKVGKRVIVGAGAVIKKDCEEDGVYSAPGTSLLNKDSFNTKL
ncbi:MAG: acetyltransferase [Bacteroidetes bacterium]|nr:acetyltransferase [Bacteroidota bacterium]